MRIPAIEKGAHACSLNRMCMIHPERIQRLNDTPVVQGGFVLYWMQASQRARGNHALEEAVRRANDLELPVLVFFGLTDAYPAANARHYAFMLEGLSQVSRELAARGIRLVTRAISPEKGVVEIANNAALVVVDRGYLRVQRQWRAYAAERLPCPLVQVESDAVVPVDAASAKLEFSAATLRPKIRRNLGRFLVPLGETPVRRSSLAMNLASLDLSRPEEVLAGLDVDRSVRPVAALRGGTERAEALLGEFVEGRLAHYGERKNDPAEDCVSHMSPYLHFGQISPLQIALRIFHRQDPSTQAYLEELVVRRELSLNHVLHNPLYDSYEGLPAWARKTLEEHRDDPRPSLYSRDELDAAATRDPYWNAAQRQMRSTGKMHGYMRMYWGKKILEWTAEPAEAFATAVALNDRYELDGRDPNGYTGVAWCFGRHDRPWPERPIFGKVRFMNAQGLKRKFAIDRYVRAVESLAATERP